MFDFFRKLRNSGWNYARYKRQQVPVHKNRDAQGNYICYECGKSYKLGDSESIYHSSLAQQMYCSTQCFKSAMDRLPNFGVSEGFIGMLDKFVNKRDKSLD